MIDAFNFLSSGTPFPRNQDFTHAQIEGLTDHSNGRPLARNTAEGRETLLMKIVELPHSQL